MKLFQRIARVQGELDRRKRIDRDIREALESTFETVPGDRRFCIRRQEVVDHVAKTLGIKVLNNATFHDVQRTARTLGWEAIKNGNRSLFRCVKPRGIAAEAALVLSRSNRHDQRAGRSAN